MVTITEDTADKVQGLGTVEDVPDKVQQCCVPGLLANVTFKIISYSLCVPSGERCVRSGYTILSIKAQVSSGLSVVSHEEPVASDEFHHLFAHTGTSFLQKQHLFR